MRCVLCIHFCISKERKKERRTVMAWIAFEMNAQEKQYEKLTN